jgi:hypothetical protein
MACGSLLGFHLWNEAISVPEAAFLGVSMGLIYAVLFWEYRPSDAPPEAAPDAMRK